MPFVSWSEEYSVGVKQFDNDHIELIGYINKLHIALLAGNAPEEMQIILKSLMSYTVKHFHSEEELMTKYAYPKFITHKDEHTHLVKELTDFAELLKTGKSSFSIELMSFLKDWLMEHINKSDKAYSAFFNKNGIK